MPFEHWRRGWTETKITERSCWRWRWVGAGWNASKGRTLFFCHFLFLALSWMNALFALTATALPFSSLQLPPRFLGESCWKLCIAFFWLNWFLLFFWALIHPKYWLRKVKVAQMGLCTLWGFPFYSSPCVLLFLPSKTTAVGISASEDDELAIFSAS